MQNKNWVWTDELVGQFAYWYKNIPRPVYDPVKDFKELKSKELSDKDYEILRMIDEIGHIHTPDTHDCPYLKDSKIYSVKRLSDNEPFSLKDVTNEGTIKSFYIEDNVLWVTFFETGGAMYINDIEKVKDPVHLTDDGKPILEDSKYWAVRLHDGAHTSAWDIKSYTAGKIFLLDRDNFKYFSTEDKAKEYVTLHKPCLSVADLLHLWCLDTSEKERLKELAQQKINNV